MESRVIEVGANVNFRISKAHRKRQGLVTKRSNGEVLELNADTGQLILSYVGQDKETREGKLKKTKRWLVDVVRYNDHFTLPKHLESVLAKQEADPDRYHSSSEDDETREALVKFRQKLAKKDNIQESENTRIERLLKKYKPENSKKKDDQGKKYDNAKKKENEEEKNSDAHKELDEGKKAKKEEEMVDIIDTVSASSSQLMIAEEDIPVDNNDKEVKRGKSKRAAKHKHRSKSKVIDRNVTEDEFDQPAPLPKILSQSSRSMKHPGKRKLTKAPRTSYFNQSIVSEANIIGSVNDAPPPVRKSMRKAKNTGEHWLYDNVMNCIGLKKVTCDFITREQSEHTFGRIKPTKAQAISVRRQYYKKFEFDKKREKLYDTDEGYPGDDNEVRRKSKNTKRPPEFNDEKYGKRLKSGKKTIKKKHISSDDDSFKKPKKVGRPKRKSVKVSAESSDKENKFIPHPNEKRDSLGSSKNLNTSSDSEFSKPPKKVQRPKKTSVKESAKSSEKNNFIPKPNEKSDYSVRSSTHLDTSSDSDCTKQPKNVGIPKKESVMASSNSSQKENRPISKKNSESIQNYNEKIDDSDKPAKNLNTSSDSEWSNPPKKVGKLKKDSLKASAKSSQIVNQSTSKKSSESIRYHNEESDDSDKPAKHLNTNSDSESSNCPKKVGSPKNEPVQASAIQSKKQNQSISKKSSESIRNHDKESDDSAKSSKNLNTSSDSEGSNPPKKVGKSRKESVKVSAKSSQKDNKSISKKNTESIRNHDKESDDSDKPAKNLSTSSDSERSNPPKKVGKLKKESVKASAKFLREENQPISKKNSKSRRNRNEESNDSDKPTKTKKESIRKKQSDKEEDSLPNKEHSLPQSSQSPNTMQLNLRKRLNEQINTQLMQEFPEYEVTVEKVKNGLSWFIIFDDLEQCIEGLFVVGPGATRPVQAEAGDGEKMWLSLLSGEGTLTVNGEAQSLCILKGYEVALDKMWCITNSLYDEELRIIFFGIAYDSDDDTEGNNDDDDEGDGDGGDNDEGGDGESGDDEGGDDESGDDEGGDDD